MAEIIPFPGRASRPPPQPALPVTARSHDGCRLGATAEAWINALACDHFWVINRDVPADGGECLQILKQLTEAVSRVSADFGGPEQMAALYRGGVRVFLSQPRLAWKTDRFDVPEFLLPNTARAADIERVIRQNARMA